MGRGRDRSSSSASERKHTTKKTYTPNKTKDGKKQTLAEYEKSLVEDYKRRSQLNLSS